MNATVSKNPKVARINVAEDYSRYPAGRFRTDGPFSGQKFREDLLVPALNDTEIVEVQLDGTAGFGSSFLEEAFGGLIRLHILSPAQASERVRLLASDESLVSEIREYMGLN